MLVESAVGAAEQKVGISKPWPALSGQGFSIGRGVSHGRFSRTAARKRTSQEKKPEPGRPAASQGGCPCKIGQLAAQAAKRRWRPNSGLPSGDCTWSYGEYHVSLQNCVVYKLQSCSGEIVSPRRCRFSCSGTKTQSPYLVLARGISADTTTTQCVCHKCNSHQREMFQR